MSVSTPFVVSFYTLGVFEKSLNLHQKFKKEAIMRTTSNFAQNLLGMQSELHRFALKLTADTEEANGYEWCDMEQI